MNRILSLFVVAIGLTAWLIAAEPAAVPDPLSPEAEQKTFQLADDDLVIELVAAEPAVVSPVAMAWDAAGRLFVAEMDDYPVGPDKGHIRLLEDRDGDGTYETSTNFADDVSFPTGVLPIGSGLLVTSAPDILLLQDTDGDGQADRREVLLTGFNPGNQQLRANGLTWGADNWIYGANGRSGGEIRRPKDPIDQAVGINGRDFRFRPDGSGAEAVTGHSQFGLGRDDWGQRFASWNTIVLRHALLEPPVLDRYPQLAGLACRDIADPADTTRVFAVSSAPRTFNNEPTDFYNAMCGLTIFRGDALGPDYVGDPFVCESLRNLVHRRKLVPDGPTFISKRALPDREFLTSTDAWFHPVFLTTGPDGALYVADFYRRWVEHPEWLAGRPERGEIDWREGSNHGRIWRIRRRDHKVHVERLDRATPAELVKALSSPNAWRRDTAQRLLVERSARNVVADLSRLAADGSTPQSRLHALWTLSGRNQLDAKTLARAFGDDSPQVRRQAVKLSGAMLAPPPPEAARNAAASKAPLRAALMQAAGDADPAVRFEVALAIGSLDGPDKDAAVARLAALDRGDLWDSVALQLALGDSAWPFLKSQIAAKPAMLTSPNAAEQKLLENLGLLVGRRHELSELLGGLSLVAGKADVADPAGVLALSAGLTQGCSDGGVPLRKLMADGGFADFGASLPEIPKLLARAAKVSLDPDAALATRLRAVNLLAHMGTAGDPADLLPLLSTDQPPEISRAAADCLARLADAPLAEKLFATRADYTAATRRALESSALRSPVMTTALLAALEAGTIMPLELDAAVRDLLLSLPDKELHQRARKILAAVVPADRQEVLADYAAALTLAADRRHGGALVSQHCLVCHQIQGRGRRIGPDLSGIGSHHKDQILISLLDPSRQVSPDFLAYTLVTEDGEVLTGLLISETPGSVTLRRTDGTDEIVPRSNVEVLKAAGKLIMPDGFEQKLTVQDVADMLDFLSRPDASMLIAPDAPAAEAPTADAKAEAAGS